METAEDSETEEARPAPYVPHLYVVYDSPRDFPGQWVVRRWDIGMHGSLIARPEQWLGMDLEEARAHIPHGLTRMGRDPLDDPALVEVWI